MRSLLNLAHYSSAILAFVATVSAVRAARRAGDSHRFDVVWPLAALAYLNLGPSGRWTLIFLSLQVLQPYFLLRLISHVRAVPRVLSALALGVAAAAVGAAILLPESSPVRAVGVPAMVSALLAYGALALALEARRARGLTVTRLILAAVGAGSLAAPYAITVGAHWSDALDDAALLSSYLNAIGCAGYYLAFSTPRWLRAAWQRAAQSSYLTATARHDAEERGARTAEDLRRALAGSVTNAQLLIALRDAHAVGGAFVVQTATDARLVGLEIRPNVGVVGRAMTSARAVAGPVAETGPELSSHLAAAGSRVLVAPIANGDRVWGVAVVVQRRGALFPEDDLDLLADLARYAAMSLDHADLVRDQRERARKAADRRLREVESRMGLMLETIKDYAMLVLDHRGRIVTWPSGAEHVFGASAAVMQDESATPLFGLSDAEGETLLDETRQRGRAEREATCRRPDGTTFVGSIVVRPLPSDVDRLDGFVAVVRDVTERRQLEGRLRQTEKMDAIGQLAGGIAHDFNNLLTAILGYSDWLAQDFRADDPRRVQVAEIQRAGERAAGLTKQLLAFSRRQALDRTPVNLSQLVKATVPSLRAVVGDHIEIAGNVDPDVAPIVADAQQVEQILVNLAENARDAMPNGGRLLIRTANVGLDERDARPDVAAGAFVLLEVSDTGTGMDDATKARAFEPFFTTKEFGRGTGLGLATVYGLVKEMDGLVTVTSEPARGSTFRLFFPAART